MKLPRIFVRTGIEATILFAFVAGATAYITARTLNNELRRDYESKGVAIVNGIATSSPELLFNHDGSRIQTIIDQYVDESARVSYVYVVDERGEIIAHTFIPAIPHEISADSQSRKSKTISIADISIKGRGAYVDIASPILAGFAGYVHVGMDKSRIDAYVAANVRQQLLVIFVLFLVAMTIALIRTRHVTTPMAKLAEAAHTIGTTGVAPALELSKSGLSAIAARRDEIGDLAHEFQRMAEQIHERELNLRAAGDAAAERERHFRFLADTMPQIVWTTRADGGVDYFNQRWYDYSGQTFEQTKEWSWSSVIHPADLKVALERWTRSVETGCDYDVEYRIKRASDGEFRWHLARAFAMRDAAGAIVRWFGTCTDIHDYKLAQEALRAANFQLEEKVRERTSSLSTVNVKLITEVEERKKALEELKAAKETAELANQSKSEFLANMSHELRTPLNGVIGMAELLINSKLSGRQQEYAITVRRSAESLLTLLNDILDLSKIEAGKLTLEEIPFDLQSVVEEVSILMSARAVEKNLELIVRYSPSAPRRFIGDSLRVRQVITNIVGNAVKFTARGHVLIDVDCEVRTHGQARMRIRVEDTGIGISPEQSTRLFKKFSQCDSTTTRRYGGSGLGLVICKNIVELMNGAIVVASNPDKGSVFTISFSLPECEQREAPQAVSPELQNLRFLIVDDNAVNRRVLCEQLAGWKLQHTAVESGPAALQAMLSAAATNEPFDVAIIDYQMPEMDGEMLAREIKSNPATSKTMLLMLSSMGHFLPRERLNAAGLEGILQKPTRQSVLLETLNHRWAVYTGMRPADRSSRGNIATAAIEIGPRAAVKKMHLLLVEDNEVNREVALGMLEAMGCDAEVALDGREGVELYSTHRFDAVLMDCQMPVMDGFEATREIRRLEQASGSKMRIPIIAMTANAMKGDRERCLECGMDEYVSKPMRLDTLSAALAKIVRRNPSPKIPVQVPRASSAARSLPLFNYNAALDIASGKPALLKRILNAFAGDAPKRLKALDAALESGDAQTAAREAHSLKGAALNIAAETVRTRASEAERACNSGDLAKAKEIFPLLTRDVTELLEQLADVLEVSVPS